MNNQYQNAIANYLSTRLRDNADWYHHTGRIDEFHFSLSDQMIFYVTHYVIFQLLYDGHTVLVIKDDHQQLGKLKAWQASLLTPIMDRIKDEVGDEFDFDEIFHRIEQLQADNSQLSHYIHEQRHHFTTSYHKQQAQHDKSRHRTEQGSEQILAQLSELFVNVLRFYYVSTIHLNQDLHQFIQRLYGNPFFTHVDDEVLHGTMVFYHDDELYLWLNRSYQAERALLAAIHRIRHSLILSIELPPSNATLNQEQKHAIRQVAGESFSIITGGPGTGKTFTVAQIVLVLQQALHHQSDDARSELSLALVAPTGKASQRMAESLQHALQDSQTKITLPEPMTIHRLLGIGMNGIPHYHESNPLPYELIIVDEASMLGTQLASHLLCAVKSGARIILLGDAHQLSAVDAGAVLADLCLIPSLSSVRTELIHSNRFDSTSGIGRLATLINTNDEISINALIGLIEHHANLSLTNIDYLNQRLSSHAFYQKIAHDYLKEGGFFEMVKTLKFQFNAYDDDKKQYALKSLYACFNKYRILTASHLGYCGDEMINGFIEKLHREQLKLTTINSPWYHGRPIMILKNRYDLGLFNGDIGICLQSGRDAHELAVYFGESTKGLSVSLLEDTMVSTAYAMTVHKSQGSEFDKVAVVFSEENERLLSKELIYTAITRAKTEVAIYTTEKALLKAVNTPTIRQTGLLIHERLMKKSPA